MTKHHGEPPVGRLAPSPTGAQHIGNARTFLLAWLSIRSRGGRIVLRMEDIDGPRIKLGAAAQAILDLRWLGLDWDDGPDPQALDGPFVQSQRQSSYADLLAELQLASRVFPCTCTRGDIAAAASAPHVGQEGPIYPGTCRQLSVADALRQDRPVAWRFRVPSVTDTYRDGFHGPVSCRLAEDLGDFVLYKNDGTAAYQLAVVADDHAMGITEVLRGDDLLPSGFRQRALYRELAWRPPEFVHVPLVVGPDGRRLAKRHGDTRLASLREAGIPAERLIGLLAASCGWLDEPTEIAAAELLNRFRLDTIPPTPWVFTEAHRQWLGLD